MRRNVSLAAPELLEALAALDETAVSELGRSWAEALDGVAEEAAVALVGRMSMFARQSATAGMQVLELDVM